MKHLQTLSTDLLKALALMQHNGEQYFLFNGEAYEGTEAEAREKYDTDSQFFAEPQTFEDWTAENIEKVEEYTEDYNNTYMVLTDEEADEKAAEYIKESLWAFNADFIIQHSKLPYEAKEMIESHQREKCESANETIEALIDDMDEFISDAISADGRGHFLNTYDGYENEETVEGDTFYIYRMN